MFNVTIIFLFFIKSLIIICKNTILNNILLFQNQIRKNILFSSLLLKNYIIGLFFIFIKNYYYILNELVYYNSKLKILSEVSRSIACVLHHKATRSIELKRRPLQFVRTLLRTHQASPPPASRQQLPIQLQHLHYSAVDRGPLPTGLQCRQEAVLCDSCYLGEAPQFSDSPVAMRGEKRKKKLKQRKRKRKS